MAVTHTTIGFKGTVGQVEEAQRMARLGPRGTVADPAAWLVSIAAGDRMVSIAAGSGQACGVQDSTTAADTVQLNSNGTSGTATRYDLIIARWRWTDPVTPVTFTFVTGTPGAAAPNLAGLTRVPGTGYDMPIAVVRVAGGQGALTANDIFDARVFGGVSGPLLMVGDIQLPSGWDVRTLVDALPGARLRAGLSDYLRTAAGAWRLTSQLFYNVLWPEATVAGSGNSTTPIVQTPAGLMDRYRVTATTKLVTDARGSVPLELQLFMEGQIRDRVPITGLPTGTTNAKFRPPQASKTLTIADGRSIAIAARLDIPAGSTASTYTNEFESWLEVLVTPY